MSLIVREKAQPLLDQAGFSMFHAAMKINYNAPNLMLLRTVCGKQVAVIHGVEFSSANPSVKEIEFAVELLGDWLDRNSEKLSTYVDAWIKHEEMEAPPDELEGMKHKKYANEHSVHFYNEHGVEFIINQHGLYDVCWGRSKSLKGDWAEKLTVSPDTVKAAAMYLHQWLVYQKLADTVTRLHSELTACNT